MMPGTHGLLDLLNNEQACSIKNQDQGPFPGLPQQKSYKGQTKWIIEVT